MKKSIKYLIFLFLFLSFVNFVYATTIYDIQYTTSAGEDGTYPSPYDGQDVTVTGIVTGNAGTGFYITDPEGGAWHGIYVYSYDYNPSVGDEVEVGGTVSEYYGLTEIGYATMTVLSSDNQVPATLPVSTEELVDGADAECFEGCLVELGNVVVTAEVDEHGQWYVTDASGTPCQIDDGMFEYPNPQIGDEFASITGVVDYSYSEYGLNPRSEDDFIAAPGYIQGTVILNEGFGNVENVEVSAGDQTVNPDDQGDYIITINPGTYDVTAFLSGYSTETEEGVVVICDEYTTINFTLEWEETTIVIDSIQTFPEIVFVDDSITVTARTTPYNCSLVADTLLYKINDGEYQKIEMDSIDLYKYSCIIPQINETGELSFYVKATGRKNDDSIFCSISSIKSINVYPRSPIITSVIYNVSNDSIFVEASIVDYDGLVQNAYLKCQLDFSENYFTYPMVVDTVDTTLYTGIIPPQSQGSTIYYYICAVDDSGLVSCEGDTNGEPFEHQYDVTDHKAVLIVDHHTFCPTLGEKFEIQVHSRAGDKIILRLYNSEGKLVYTFRNEVSKGINTLEWDGKDETWNTLPPGLYICHLEVIDRDTGKTKTDTVPIVIAAPLKH